MMTSAKAASWAEFQRRWAVSDKIGSWEMGDVPQWNVTKPPSQSAKRCTTGLSAPSWWSSAATDAATKTSTQPGRLAITALAIARMLASKATRLVTPQSFVPISMKHRSASHALIVGSSPAK